MSLLAEDLPRCLAIPELLRIIFGYLDDSDNCRNAQVCKTWSDVALDRLWHSPASIYRVFNALSPLSSDSTWDSPKFYDFAETPSAQEWARFSAYSSRLHTLKYKCDEGRASAVLSRDLFTTVAVTRPSITIFPNSKRLIWLPSIPSYSSSWIDLVWKDDEARLFMHPGIVHFQCRLLHHIIGGTSPNRFLMDIPCRMPNLTDLDIITQLPPGSLDVDLCAILPQLPRLEMVSLPACHLSARLCETLSTLPSLNWLDYDYADAPVTSIDHSHHRHLPPLALLTPVSIRNGFVALDNFVTLGNYLDICELVVHMTQLTRLRVDSKHAWETADSLQQLLEVASIHCPRLVTLELESMRTRQHLSSRITGLSQSHQGTISPITFQTLQPITKLSGLTELSIGDTVPFTLSLSELDILLSSLSHLKILHLNYCPLRLTEAPFGLDALPLIGRRCRSLEIFSGFLDATKPIPLIEEDHWPLLPALRMFSVSTSIINQRAVADVALFLARIFPRACKIRLMKVEWPAQIPDRVDEKNLIDLEIVRAYRLQLWHQVKQLVPALRRMLDEKMTSDALAQEATRPLQYEIQQLRARLRLLEGGKK